MENSQKKVLRIGQSTLSIVLCDVSEEYTKIILGCILTKITKKLSGLHIWMIYKTNKIALLETHL